MNKYIAVAAVSTVSACHMKEMMEKPLMGLLEQSSKCPVSEAPKFKHIEALRKLAQNMHRGWVKGWYQENTDVLTDKCFGDSIEPVLESAWGLKKKMHEDFWAVDLKEVKSVGEQVLDTIYGNMDDCHFQRIGDDMKDWCLANPGMCLMGEDLEDRLVDNFMSISGVIMDLTKILNTDDSCYSDAEQMAEIYRVMVDIGELSAELSGFDYKWDMSVERTHVKRKEFHMDIKNALKEFKGIDELAFMFPGIHDLLAALEGLAHELRHQLKDTLKDVRKEVHDFFHNLFPHHQHHEATHTEHKNLWHNPLDFFKPQKTQKIEHHEQKKIDPVGDLFKQLFPEPKHQQKRADPIQEMMDGLFMPHHQTHQQVSPWGQMQMPMQNQWTQFQQPQFGFENFKLF